MDELAPLTVQTPRQSKRGLILAFLLLLLSAALWAFIYWGWQRHLELI